MVLGRAGTARCLPVVNTLGGEAGFAGGTGPLRGGGGREGAFAVVLRNVILELRNVSFELRNVSSELRNVGLVLESIE